MNPLHDILSSIDPSKARIFSATPPARTGTGYPKPATNAQRPTPRPTQPTNGTADGQALKRKASNPGDAGQNKLARKEAPAPLVSTNGARSGSAPVGTRSTSTTPTTSMPYRGTAALGASRPAASQVKKPLPATAGQQASAKVAPSTSRPTIAKPATSAAGTSATPVKKAGGYLAMLQKAKEKDATKPAAPLAKPEPTKIMTKKEREAARLAAKAGGKGKKPVTGASGRATDARAAAAGSAQEKRKPADLGYQGTARPAKKPEVGYKGTARPATAASSATRPGAAAAAAKKKSKPVQDRYAGYANWSDLDDMDDEDEEDYDSDGSSDMEGGIWDVEREEAEALKAAKREDAEALAEENAHKREKEERRKKLAAMNKAMAAKRKY